MWIPATPDHVLTPTAIALGNFDGLHRGHQAVIAPILHHPDTWATVVTFQPHPVEYFSGQPRALLTPLPEKQAILERWGVQQLVLLTFDRELAQMTPAAFVQEVLHQQLQARWVSVGADFCFGRGRQGNAQLLQELGEPLGIRVTIVPEQTLDGERISSSRIRERLLQGQVEAVERLLGRPYALIGEVVPGRSLGHRIGFPTANLQLPARKFLPRQGVYCVQVWTADGTHPRPGVMNLGYRPTVDGQTLTAEVHLLRWRGDLYGQTLQVELRHFLRPEQKFPSLEALQAQIQRDCQAATEYFQLPLEQLEPT
ncbi:MAG: bifunctional riboflavin kinase/FAD synthetase [Gloeomargarita sp. SKYBB_i_bin120]|nr:bifunctional riboflavin kinase/FAD synthetase [Gloeomargarita sp. SKYG98]MCS7293490.1 bifunctional riboflavin kinase/FAD synthetase [Gloeomargarita sp. SKYB120]MDW8179056.1 bifunctional riboflavin kinase/FAD synthetase [Gloeomargarita sp. SKYBB_i_bin120]